MTPRRAFAAVALTLTLGGACSGGGSPDAGPSTSTSATPVTPGTVSAATSSTTALTSAGLLLDPHGLGPVRVGMTIEAASTALGRPLKAVTAPTEDCTLYAPDSGFDGVSFLVAGQTVARVDVTSGPTTTAEGLAIGQTEAEARRRYGNRLVVSPHDFVLGGNYLTLVPTGPDANLRLVAETDGTKVTGMRAGRLPEVELTEGCS